MNNSRYKYDIKRWLPTTKKELEKKGWNDLDVIIFSGDAYVDHPAFGAAVIGRIIEAKGLKVAIVPQPNWKDDLRDFKKLGKPNLFFGVTAGNMDSMVNHYTANKRLRSTDAYTPGNQSGFRPDYPTVVYSKILKELYPDTPVIIGGIEASLRRFTHYDYWSDKLKSSILYESKADLLIYGMGEKTVISIISELKKGSSIEKIKNIPQTVYLTIDEPKDNKCIKLYSHEECLKSKYNFAENFKYIETESNRYNGQIIVQKTNDKFIVANPPFLPLKEEELDSIYNLPYTYMPHPKYNKKKPIPAYEMIKHSITIHRGCFGGCSFCTISAHQGKFVSSRSEKSILTEIEKIKRLDNFKGYISDLGGPSANMFKMEGENLAVCKKCKRASCIYPGICSNLNADHLPLTKLYDKSRKIKGIKKISIGSGIRYDLIYNQENPALKKRGLDYIKSVIKFHVSGRLKVAPEHTEDSILKLVRKPIFNFFIKLKNDFDTINSNEKLNQQIIPYFISGLPGCSIQDMANLAIKTKNLKVRLDQVQEFTPTPMTLATVMYYTGINPYTGKKLQIPKKKSEREIQKKFFFWHTNENRQIISKKLKSNGLGNLIQQLYSKKSIG